MHAQVLDWLVETLRTLPPRHRVLEIGSKDINGSARSVIDVPAQPIARYLGVDTSPGRGVDLVVDGEFVEPDFRPDTIVCCEVFEHTPRWPQMLARAYTLLEDDGFVLLTMATDPRGAHSAVDGGPLRAGEYYGNVPPVALVDTLAACGFDHIRIAVAERRGDLYAVAQKPARE
jgi:hypothetical protein